MIIAFSGYAGAGKDTAAQVLVEEYGFTKMSFAQPLKQALWALNPLIEVNKYEDEIELEHIYLQDLVQNVDNDEEWRYAKEFPEVRRLLQRLGTEVGRDLFGLDVWVDQLFDHVEVGQKIVITDMRFFNEWQAVTDLSGVTVRIESEKADKPVNSHSSETELEGVAHNVTITNNGTIEEFQETVRLLCASLDLTLD